ncbi:hypothetical protein [Accumulibacter sp.]|uniref:hypothetical protein n=1 Tax=Accumulibacter sp. TaxID=2053492 RepID=UPI0025DB0348|nr:hypothetical protein [Accumulibacter sp.]MCM8596143.1 hypothetical protein [Accumulibacter sp.]MCM8625577.1 hypothetical protein [Accumulibacter sp.]MDS4050292.1 hypothetical protein [Accumulibacter sp.]
MPLLKNLISIPERVPQGDFVLQLTRGVSEPEQTPRDYVGTPQKVDAFNNALGFIQQAVQTASSKAAHLYGSFGSGGGAARPNTRTVSTRPRSSVASTPRRPERWDSRRTTFPGGSPWRRRHGAGASGRAEPGFSREEPASVEASMRKRTAGPANPGIWPSSLTGKAR